MNIQTKYFGECEIQEEDIVRFEAGIPGFLDEKQFVILPLDESQDFYVMQSLTTQALAFVVTSPFIFDKNYDFTIPEATVESLKLTNENQVAVFVILTLHDPFEKSTANLKAPVVINVETKLGKQLVLNDSKYEVKQPLNLKNVAIGQED